MDDSLKRRPLSDPEVATDVLDLLVGPADRAAGALFLLLCDGDDHLVQPVAIDGVPPDCDTPDRERALETFAELLVDGDYGLLVAVARPGDPSPTPGDVRWLTVAEDVCERTGVRLIGVYIVTPRGLRELTRARRSDSAGPLGPGSVR